MNKKTSLGWMIIAILLMILSAEAYQSTSSVISRSMTGATTDNVMWLAIGGLIAAITGIFGFSSSESQPH